MALSESAWTKVISPENLLMFSGVIAAFHLGKVSPAIPVLQSTLNLTVIQAGFLISLMQFAGATCGLIMGILSEKISACKSIIIGQSVLLISSLLAIFVDQPFQLLVLRAFESFGFLMVILPTPSLIRILVPAENLFFRIGLWGCYMAIGTSVAFMMGPFFIDIIGWKGWWLIPASFSAVSILFLIKMIPTALKDINFSKKIYSLKDLWTGQLRSILRHRNAWFIGLAFAMYTGPWIAIIGFLPILYVQAGISNVVAGLLTALASLVNIFGNVLAAILIHRGVRIKRLLATGYLTMLTTGIIAFSSLIHSSLSIQFIAILFFSAVGGLIPAILYVLGVKSAPNDETVVTTIGFIQQFSSIGMLLIPPLIAQLAVETGSWSFTWLITGTAALLGLFLAIQVAQEYQ